VNGIGGKIEEGETSTDAMCREFKEEIGVETDTDEWKLFATVYKPDEYFVYFYFAKTDKVYNVKTVEAEEVAVYNVDNLPKNMINNLNWLIPMSLDPKLNLLNPIKIEELR